MTEKLLTIELTSFSYKNPIPGHLFTHDGGRHGGGFVFDCRSLPNPGRDPKFANATGKDVDVIAYLEREADVRAFKNSITTMIEPVVTKYLERGFDFLSISFGCTGGQHRSVYLTEETKKFLLERFKDRVKISLVHNQFPELNK